MAFDFSKAVETSPPKTQSGNKTLAQMTEGERRAFLRMELQQKCKDQIRMLDGEEVGKADSNGNIKRRAKMYKVQSDGTIKVSVRYGIGRADTVKMFPNNKTGWILVHDDKEAVEFYEAAVDLLESKSGDVDKALDDANAARMAAAKLRQAGRKKKVA